MSALPLTEKPPSVLVIRNSSFSCGSEGPPRVLGTKGNCLFSFIQLRHSTIFSILVALP